MLRLLFVSSSKWAITGVWHELETLSDDIVLVGYILTAEQLGKGSLSNGSTSMNFQANALNACQNGKTRAFDKFAMPKRILSTGTPIYLYRHWFYQHFTSHFSDGKLSWIFKVWIDAWKRKVSYILSYPMIDIDLNYFHGIRTIVRWKLYRKNKYISALSSKKWL